MSIRQGKNIIAGKGGDLNNPYSLFDCKFSDHTLNNASWLRADTFTWYDGNVYVDAYEHLVQDVQNAPVESEIIEGVTIYFYKCSDGHKVIGYDQYTDERVIHAYNSTGVAWYYILDTTNKRFKLPRTKWGFKGVRNVVGNDIVESLPNIKGQLMVDPYNVNSNAFYGLSGAFYEITTTGTFASYGNAGESTKNDVAIFDASRSSSTYQDNAPVQERGTQMYLYFYVGETVQNANLIDAGRIAEQLTNKVDLDTNNLSVTGKANIVSYCMPDYYQQIYNPIGSPVVAGTLIQVQKDSLVTVWGIDSYTEDYYVFVTDETSNPVKFAVGRRFDDTDGNTESTSFSFQVPKGWYFTCTAEAGFEYRIFPYRGAN